MLLFDHDNKMAAVWYAITLTREIHDKTGQAEASWLTALYT